MIKWNIAIGLEVHIQLSTESKIFSKAKNQYGNTPNTQVSGIDLGLPGTLPILNKRAIEFAIRLGLAINAKIPTYFLFVRKNYFYPDLSKGYQISQNKIPILMGGYIPIAINDSKKYIKKIFIHHAHLEEDAGKLVHTEKNAQIDFNRSGNPLLEVVTKPNITSAKEAISFLKELHLLVRYLKISHANMEKGEFRCDVNISVSSLGSSMLGTKTECKNLNSFKFIEKAIIFESKRQIALLESGKFVIQETRLFDSKKNITKKMRIKEHEHDYRYFPEPDLLPVKVTYSYIKNIHLLLPELPNSIRNRLKSEHYLDNKEIEMFLENPQLLNFYEKLVFSVGLENSQLASNWITSILLSKLKKYKLSVINSPIKIHHLSNIIFKIKKKLLSNKTAKIVFNNLWITNGKSHIDDIIYKKKLLQINDINIIEKTVNEVIDNFPKEIIKYHNGKTKILDFLLGKIIQKNKKANPKKIKEILIQKLFLKKNAN